MQQTVTVKVELPRTLLDVVAEKLKPHGVTVAEALQDYALMLAGVNAMADADVHTESVRAIRAAGGIARYWAENTRINRKEK